MIYKVEKTISYYYAAYIEADSPEEAKKLAYNEDTEWIEDSEDVGESIDNVLVPYDEEGNLIETMKEVDEYIDNGNYVEWAEPE